MPMDKMGSPRSGMARSNFANKVHGEPGSKPAKPMAAPAAAPSKMEEHEADSAMHAHSHKGGEHDVSEMPIKDVVAEHGPATHVFSEHDHEAGKHHVHSVHGEKHHHSDHESHHAAHQHMGEAMGAGEGAEDDESAPFAGKQTPEEEQLEETVTHGKAHKGMGLG